MNCKAKWFLVGKCRLLLKLKCDIAEEKLQMEITKRIKRIAQVNKVEKRSKNFLFN